MDSSALHKAVAKGLNSPELKRNPDIPYVDENDELNHVRKHQYPEVKIDNADTDSQEEIEEEKVPLIKSNSKPKIQPSSQRAQIHASDLGTPQQSPNSDTIVVNTPEGTLYITLDPDTAKSSPNSPRTFSSEVATPSTSKDDSKKMLDKELENEIELRRAGLRRNSISMPTLPNLEMEVFKQQYLNSEIPEHHQSTASGFSDGDNNENNTLTDEDERPKPSSRSPRSKRGPRRLRSEFSMEDEDYSPSNSVTSVNSLASLLREKLQSIPQKIRKKPTDYKLRGFVVLMFIALILYVCFAYGLYRQAALTKSYLSNVQFNRPQRMIRIFNTEDVEIFKVSLAMGLAGKKQEPFPCLPEHQKSDGSKCLEWLNAYRFYLKCIPHDAGLDNTTCYSVHWKALRDDVYPNDCFDWGDTKVNWYGGGQALNVSWPVNTGSIDYTPFITGDIRRSQWGNVLTRYMINSKGAAVIIDEETPLQISVNNNGKKEICLKSKYDNFAYANKFTKYAEMKYNICTSQDMKSLHSSIHNHRKSPLWDGLKPADISTLETLMREPVWQIAPKFKHELQTEMISKYTEHVDKSGFLKHGHVVINEYWQNEIGDLEIDTNRFQNLTETLDKLHRRGFRIALTVQPFISTESKNFAECVQKRLLISERSSDKRIPALTRFKSLPSAGVLDVTNNRSVPWFAEKLHAVKEKWHIDAFYFDLGTAFDMPHYYQCEKRLINPDQYKTIFTKTFEKTFNIIGVSSAVALPKPPIFVSLPPFESTWDALQRVIPTMLTYGVNGFPFIMPGAVGGDVLWPGTEQLSVKETVEETPINIEENPFNTTQGSETGMPDKELYLRWLQMATFLPVMKFTHLPSEYNDDKVVEMAKNLTLLRQNLVTPLLLKYKREALEEGLPLIRPLWLLAGGDPTLFVRDEFALGDEIVVAPILNPQQTTREVYLPAGLWQDGIDGSLHKGNRWMHEYKVPHDRIAYFLRRPDNMRF